MPFTTAFARERMRPWAMRTLRWAIVFAGAWGILFSNTQPTFVAIIAIAVAAVYLRLFPSGSVHVVNAVGVASLTVAVWWVLYGRRTPFPTIWVFPDGPTDTAADLGSGWWWASVVAVAGLLTAHSVLRPSDRADRGVSGWIWFAVSVWAVDRGDQDGLWALAIPFLALVALTMLATSNLIAKACLSLSGNHHQDATA